ncbi:protein of unknown function [Methylocaldum szegediense]|uniref:Uncharacterized protein n=1 Tax=Methylocaldum szegediense TaxID=73780 RepID=A0ABM9I516_9GAMM|nr:protein of unknown function [Methylocaldum szegediense]
MAGSFGFLRVLGVLTGAATQGLSSYSGSKTHPGLEVLGGGHGPPFTPMNAVSEPPKNGRGSPPSSVRKFYGSSIG